jgi:ppGpp synthetase/RelA/SpoT-type nucleotidyltranferase
MTSPSNADYWDTIDGLDQFGPLICSLTEESLRESGIQIHSVTHRVKKPKSAMKKLSISPDKYKSLKDLTDLLGIRVITYFPRDVDKVAAVLKKEFAIDKQLSVDKRKLLDPDKFGYLSLHFMASLSESRSHLAEYARFSETRFEIQIRSILQHAWAEIEHDLGYKTEGALPNELRRSFSRLAGLLELADEEFERIRDQIGAYERLVSETIGDAPQKLSINQSTLIEAMKREKVLSDLDEVVSRACGVPITGEITPDYIGLQAHNLKNLDIENLDQLLKIAEQQKKYVDGFAKEWLKTAPKHVRFPIGVGLFYLGYVLAAQKADVAKSHWNRSLRQKYPDIINEINETWQKVVTDIGKP